VPSPLKIVKLGVEDVVREGLVDGLTHPEIIEAVNTELAIRHGSGQGKKGAPPSISKGALDRYLAALPEDAAAAVHKQEVAAANAAMALDFEQRFRSRMNTLNDWLEEVSNAERTMEVNGAKVNLGPDWSARKAMMSEERRWMQLYVDLMERLYNAQQVQLFQEAVMEAIRDESPEAAARIAQSLQAKVQTRAAAILGGVAA
jgi:hypothetical protein